MTFGKNAGKINVFSKCGREIEKEKKCGRNTRNAGDLVGLSYSINYIVYIKGYPRNPREPPSDKIRHGSS